MSPEEREKYYSEVSKHNATNSAEWIGAIFRYLFSFGQHKFSELYSAQEYRKNACVGILLQIILFIILFGIIVLIMG